MMKVKICKMSQTGSQTSKSTCVLNGTDLKHSKKLWLKNRKKICSFTVM